MTYDSWTTSTAWGSHGAHSGSRWRPRGPVRRFLGGDQPTRREVAVLGRNRADDTFGFGVVFSDRTLAGIHEADPVLREALADARRALGRRSRSGSRASGSAAAATGWPRSSGGPCWSCCSSGPRGRASTCASPPRSSPTDLAGYDLVVAADGANSRLRTACADDLGPSVETATAKFIWFGTDYLFDGLTFVHERGPARGLRRARLPDRRRREHVHRRDRRGVVAAAGPRRVRRHQPPGPSDVKTQGVPGEAVRRPDRRAPAAGQQLPVGQLPHPPRPALAAPGRRHRSRCSATPRTPPTSRSAPAPRWRWRTRSRSGRAGRARGRPRRPRWRYEAVRPSRRSRRSRTRPGRACPGGSTSAATTTPSSRGSSPTTSCPAASPTASCAAATPSSSRVPRRLARVHGAEPLDSPSRWPGGC